MPAPLRAAGPRRIDDRGWGGRRWKGSLRRVDAQRLADRGDQVGRRRGPLLDASVPSLAGAADRLAALDAAAGQHDRPGMGEMVAPGAGVDVRRPAELAHPHDQRRSPAIHGLSGRPSAPTSRRRALRQPGNALEVLVVRVPALQADLDERHARPRPAAGPADNPGRTACGRRRRAASPARRDRSKTRAASGRMRRRACS